MKVAAGQVWKHVPSGDVRTVVDVVPYYGRMVRDCRDSSGVRGDGLHSFGHGEFCHYCGLRDVDIELTEQHCDEREHAKPTEEESNAYSARLELSEQVAAIAEIEFGITQSIEWDEMMTKIAALRPKGT